MVGIAAGADTRAMRTATVNGAELAFEECGTGEPVLLIHGGIVADAMAPLMAQPALADAYRLLRYHRRGSGRSPWPGGPVSVAEQAADADTLFRVEAPTLRQWSLTAEDAARIAQPALLVFHADPAWTGFTATRDRLRAWLPRTENFTLPDATHLLQMMNPRDAAAGLAAFFARHPLAGAPA